MGNQGIGWQGDRWVTTFVRGEVELVEGDKALLPFISFNGIGSLVSMMVMAI